MYECKETEPLSFANVYVAAKIVPRSSGKPSPLCIIGAIPRRNTSYRHQPSKKITNNKIPICKQDQNSKTFPRRRPSKRIINSKIPVRKEDQLDSNKFQFYFEDMLWSSLSAETKNSFAYLDCFWFSLYREGLPKARVLTWVKGGHVLSKKYVLVPLSFDLCHFGESLESRTTKPCMLLLDSLEMADPRQFEPDIRSMFIFDIYKVEGKLDHKKAIRKFLCWNKDDCGFFVLYFIDLFMRYAPHKFSIDERIPFLAESMQNFCSQVTSFCR
ncbi:hypothetical protein MKX03_029515 [Papaver bracteatum]|nr:hypothetical protein MKX03_029515 [Papaver bracteatum]